MVKRISQDDWAKVQQKQFHFMQTAPWGTFKELCGIPTDYFLNNTGTVGAVVQKTQHARFPWPSWYVPFGPVVFGKEDDAGELGGFLTSLCEEAGKSGAFCLDIEPENRLVIPYLENLGFKASPSSLQPSRTVIVTLDKTEEDLLATMKQKTRYNVRLAEKKGVVIKKREDSSLEIFWQLLQETAERNEVTFYSKSYFEHLFTAVGEGVQCFEAVYEGKTIASLLLVLSGTTATYLFGASANAYRNTMANYLLHWQAMLFAKKQGYKTYDFWGISDGTAHTARWEGITRFKTSWGGEEVSYPGLYRKVLSSTKMGIFRVAKTLLGR